MLSVYKSSAGSGKTYTLVREYLKLILVGETSSYKEVLAITFTKKAAYEMKERILEQLELIADLNTENNNSDIYRYTKNLAEELNLSVLVIKSKSGQILNHILHNYNLFSVSTIDSFIKKVIESFAKELDINHDFKVELNVQNVLEKNVDLFVTDINPKKSSDLKIIKDFIFQQIKEGKSWDIANALTEQSNSKLIFDDENWKIFNEIDVNSENVINHITELRVKMNAFDVFCSNKLQELNEGLDTHFIDKVEYTGIKGKSRNPIKGLVDQLKNIKERNKISDQIKKINERKIVSWIEDGVFTTKTTSVNDESNINNFINHFLIDFVSTFYKEWKKEFTNYLVSSNYLQKIHQISILKDVVKLINEYKTNHNILLISDFNKTIHQVIKDEPIPFIYEKIGTRYKHFLIDEFQDTSEIQWMNMIPLIELSLAEGNKNLLVGDPKQSIYRFRGGKAEQFASLKQNMNIPSNLSSLEQERLQSIANHIDLKNLDTNYRSSFDVVQFNNDIITKTKSILGETYETFYDGFEQKIFKENTVGYVECKLIDKKTEDFNEDNLNYILEKVTELKELYYELEDITILTRNRNHGVKIAEYLTNNGIPIISSESLKLINDDSVKVLFNYLKIKQNPSDTISAFIIIDSLIKKGKLTTDAYQLIKNNKNNLDVVIEDVINLNLSSENKQNWHLYNTIEYISKVILEQDDNAYVNSFLNLFYTSHVTLQHNVQNFITKFEEKPPFLSSQSDVNAVQIMTIHGSKGLQFNTVIIPYFCFEKSKSADQDVWVNKDDKFYLIKNKEEVMHTNYAELYKTENQLRILDDYNIFYVGITRAVKNLFIIAKQGNKNAEVTNHFYSVIEKLPSFDVNSRTYCTGILEKKGDSNKKEKKNQLFFKPRLGVIKNQTLIISTKEIEEQNEEIIFGRNLHLYLKTLLFNQQHNKEKQLQLKLKIENEIHEKLMFLVNKTKQLFIKNNWFKNYNHIIAERNIITDNNENLIPDLVLANEKKLIIVDYKTGKENDKYVKQVKKYLNTYKKIYPEKTMEGFLLYINHLGINVIEIKK